MAQVAYHVQLTWLLVTVVTPDRLESTRLDAETVIFRLYSVDIPRMITFASWKRPESVRNACNRR